MGLATSKWAFYIVNSDRSGRKTQSLGIAIRRSKVPEGYSREAWENQIDLEDFTEQEIEDEIQVLVETRHSMDADKEVPEEKEKARLSELYLPTTGSLYPDS